MFRQYLLLLILAKPHQLLDLLIDHLLLFGCEFLPRRQFFAELAGQFDHDAAADEPVLRVVEGTIHGSRCAECQHVVAHLAGSRVGGVAQVVLAVGTPVVVDRHPVDIGLLRPCPRLVAGRQRIGLRCDGDQVEPLGLHHAFEQHGHGDLGRHFTDDRAGILRKLLVFLPAVLDPFEFALVFRLLLTRFAVLLAYLGQADVGDAQQEALAAGGRGNDVDDEGGGLHFSVDIDRPQAGAQKSADDETGHDGGGLEIFWSGLRKLPDQRRQVAQGWQFQFMYRMERFVRCIACTAILLLYDAQFLQHLEKGLWKPLAMMAAAGTLAAVEHLLFV